MEQLQHGIEIVALQSNGDRLPCLALKLVQIDQGLIRQLNVRLFQNPSENGSLRGKGRNRNCSLLLQRG